MPKGTFENPEERIRKIKEKRALQNMSFLLGDNNPSKRPEVREKIKLARKRRKERLGCINLPETREKIRKARLKQIFPIKDTSIEVKLQKELEKRKIMFEKHKPILGQPDIFIEPNICIFADGNYWHNRPERIERDKYVNQKLKEQNYQIYRFWEYDINDSIEKCVNKIKI